MIYAKSRSKPAKDYGTASKGQQIFIGLKSGGFSLPKTTTDTFGSSFNSKFKFIFPNNSQYNITLIINLNIFLIKLITPRSTGNVKRGVANLIVNTHNLPSAFSAWQRKNYNRVFRFVKNPFLCLCGADFGFPPDVFIRASLRMLG